MQKQLNFYVQVGVTVTVDVKDDAELASIEAEHKQALYDSISLNSNVDGKLTVSHVELAFRQDL